MKGDYHGCQAEFATGNDRKEAAENSLVAYKAASDTGEGNGTPLQYSCLENPTKRLHFHFHALEKEMATHSSTLVWRIPGTGEPGGLPSMESHRLRHD